MDNNSNANSSGQSQDIGASRIQNMPRQGMPNRAVNRPMNRPRNAPLNRPLANKSGNQKNNMGQNGLQNHQRPNMGAPTNNNQNGQGSEKTQTKENTTNAPSQNAGNNKANKNDVGSRNLQKSLSNKAKNLLNSKKRKKQNNDEKSDSNQQQGGNDNNTSNNNDDSKSGPLGNQKDKVKAKIKRIIIAKLVPLAFLAFIFYALIITIVGIFTGGAVFSGPSGAAKSYETAEFEAMSPEDNKYHQKELDFYKKIKKAAEDNSDININYVISALLVYYYEYEGEIDEDDEDLMEIGGIDYERMTNHVDKFVDIINSANSTDYSIDGPIYKAMKDSSDFKDYYKELLKTKSIDEILNDIFSLGSELEEFDDVDTSVITTDTKVKNKSGSMSITDYIAGAIYADTDSIDNTDLVKAYTVAHSTNLAAKNNLNINSSATAEDIVCSVVDGCSYDKNGLLVVGPGERSEKNNIYYGGKYYYRKPLTAAEIEALLKKINSVLGNVLVNEDGAYPELDTDKIKDKGDGYEDILSNSYGKYKIKNIGEDSYVLEASYGDKKVLTNITTYDQGDYSSTSFCGLKKETIKTSGCGVTSMAMIVSTYENDKKYDPIYMNTQATNKKLCGSGTGTAQSFFNRMANTMKYKYIGGSKYNKTLLNSVLKHLSQGHLVVARMGPGHFTSSGHYMVLAGVDPYNKSVYVYDPNNNSNSKWRKTGNGWYSFNDVIVKEAYNFYIIWKG